MNTPRLKEKYRTEMVPTLQKQLGISNVMAVPRLEKVVVNVGIGGAGGDPKMKDLAIQTLASITGQKPTLRRARKSIANFKVREGLEIGVSVTLRGNRMYEFLDKLINVTFPRVRDFRGLNPRAVAGRSYSVGIKEHPVFPEIDFDKVTKLHGLEVTIVTTARNKDETMALLTLLGFPFKTETK